jgi:hypothetical protein
MKSGSAVRDSRIVEIKSPLIRQPGPAALTDGLEAIVAALRAAAIGGSPSGLLLAVANPMVPPMVPGP